MAKIEADRVVTQSVLDRLIDRDPQNQSGDPAISRAQSVRLLKASVRRDLEWLLNTRRVIDEAGEDLPHLKESLFNYGLPDLSSLSLQSHRDRQRLLRSLEHTIHSFEPRLTSVRVTPVESGSLETKMLRFQIEGLLMMDPAPEQVSFDTVLQLTTGEYQVKGEHGA